MSRKFEFFTVSEGEIDVHVSDKEPLFSDRGFIHLINGMKPNHKQIEKYFKRYIVKYGYPGEKDG